MKTASEKKAPDETDRQVGQHVRMRRLVLGMSQTELGTALGVTFQQVQKYEKGTNRISAGRLRQIASVLNVPLSYLYGAAADAAPGFAEAGAPAYVPDLSWTKEGLDLVRAFGRITDPGVRRRVVELVEAIAAGQSPLGGRADALAGKGVR